MRMSESHLGVVSTFPPREDGLASFTRDLLAALPSAHQRPAFGVAITEPGTCHPYTDPVRWEIAQEEPHAYAEAGRKLTAARADLVSLQHEFTLFGRWDAAHQVIDDYTPYLLDTVRAPVVTTLHTVLPQPDPSVLAAVRQLHARSAAIVVMAHTAVTMLRDDYRLDPAKVVVVPHGVPELPPHHPLEAKRTIGLDGHTILTTFGLLRRSKGIENTVLALPGIVRRHPEVLYLVVGATHPAVRRTEGEAYRHELERLARDLGVARHLRFVNTYVEQSVLVKYLQATDIYITPYHDREQVTSGTLAYALGFGLPIVSTPYIYATEVLSDGRGLLADWDSPESIRSCVERYLDDSEFRLATQQRALAYGREMSWSHVGALYADLFDHVARLVGTRG
jgi:glycosyltransferase involved in cell wall biosynthesis